MKMVQEYGFDEEGRAMEDMRNRIEFLEATLMEKDMELEAQKSVNTMLIKEIRQRDQA